MLVAAGCAVVPAACGSSGNSVSPSGSNGASAGVKFSDCMRTHGVSNFPDPGSGGGIQIPINSGINPRSPAFQAAQSACFKLLPGSGPRRHVTEQQKQMMLRLSQCMRRHGLTDFPDPVSTPPAPGTGFGIAFGGPGSVIAVPQSMLQSPAFQGAAKACGFPGAGHVGGGKASAVGG